MTTWDPQPPEAPPTAPFPRTGTDPWGYSPPAGSFTDSIWAPPGTPITGPAEPLIAPLYAPPPPYESAPLPPPPPPPPASRRRPTGRGRRALAAVIIAILFVAGGYVVGRAANDNKATGQPAASAAPTTNGPSETAGTVAGNSEEPVEAVAAAVAPAVVQIETSTGLGSGVIYDSSGLIVTAAHVVEGETAVTIRLADGTALDGKVLGADPGTDIGVVQVKSDKALPAATLATGVAVQVGQLAVAIGSPFGLDQTVTSGVISAVDRAMPTLDGAIGMYQTDAPINPGNSGGALADRKGRVIGINDQIQTDNGGNVGVGFAIPIDVAAEVAQSIVSGTPLVHAFLGVQSSDAAGSEGGALIVQVQKGSPAEKAGLKRGDRIVAVDDSPIQSATDLVAKVRGAHAGDTMTFKIDRDGNTVTATVTLGSK